MIFFIVPKVLCTVDGDIENFYLENLVSEAEDQNFNIFNPLVRLFNV